jgi:ribosome biogenesis protein NSA2
LLHAKRHAEKVQLKKTLKTHDERNVKQADNSNVPDGALPTYLLDRESEQNAKALSTAIKQKRKDKAAKYAVPLPKVRGIAEDEIFKVLKTGKSKSKSWKRMVTKATFVGESFTRKPVKLERFVRPMALRYKKANVTHRECLAVAEWTCFTLTLKTSRSESHVPVANPWCEKESAVFNVYPTRRHDQGYRYRGERF